MMVATVLDPGQMTARFTLETPVNEPDGQGGTVLSFEATATLWVRVEPVGHSFSEETSRRDVTLTHRVWLAHRDDVKPGMRLVRGNRVLMIRMLRDPDESGRYLVCFCEEALR